MSVGARGPLTTPRRGQGGPRLGMVMKRPPVTISLSGRVPGRASQPSRTMVDDDGGCGTFRGWRLGFRVFPRIALNRRKGDVGGHSEAPHHP